MATVWRRALRVGVVLACLSGVELALAAPAQAAFATELSGLPARFTARRPGAHGLRGGLPDRPARRMRRRCAGRWCSRVQGIRLDQVKMDRVEESGDFPLEIRTEGDVARLTDRQLDPGTLCPGRTVTARYRVAFAEDVTQGRVTLAAEAYDANLRLLARQTATRSVVGAGGTPSASAKPTATPPEPSDPATTGRRGEHPGRGAGRGPADRRGAAGGRGRPPGRAVRRVRRGAGRLPARRSAALPRVGAAAAAAAPHPDRDRRGRGDPPVDRRWERPAPAGRWRPARR